MLRKSVILGIYGHRRASCPVLHGIGSAFDQLSKWKNEKSHRCELPSTELNDAKSHLIFIEIKNEKVFKNVEIISGYLLMFMLGVSFLAFGM